MAGYAFDGIRNCPHCREFDCQKCPAGDLVRFPPRRGVQREVGHRPVGTRKILVTGTTITLGPAAGDPYSLKLYLEDLLKKANLPGPTVKPSKIPYRGR